LAKLCIEVSEATGGKYIVRRARSPSTTWRSFLPTEAIGNAAIDLFVVASSSFRLLYLMVNLSHNRRKIVRTAATEHPPQLRSPLS